MTSADSDQAQAGLRDRIRRRASEMTEAGLDAVIAALMLTLSPGQLRRWASAIEDETRQQRILDDLAQDRSHRR